MRYIGTIGGNVANGDPGNDMPALMMALGATYVLRGASGERRVAARDYYQGAYETAAEPGEILAAIRVPAPPAGHGWAYEKLKRKVGDYATAAAAVILTVSRRQDRDLRDRPDQCRRDAALRRRRGSGGRSGPRSTSRRLARAAAAATAIAAPAADGRGSAEYRAKMAGVMTARALDPRLRARQILKRPRHVSQANVSMTVNGKSMSAAVEPRTLLIHYLRENLGLTGPHIGCDTRHCGACTVDLDGQSVKSCTMFAVQAEGAEVLTIEGMASADGKLHALQEGFREMHGLQCGYCTPGMIMRAHRLLQENPNPTESRNPHGHFGQSLPLHRLSEHRQAIQYAAAKMAGLEFKEAAE